MQDRTYAQYHYMHGKEEHTHYETLLKGLLFLAKMFLQKYFLQKQRRLHK